VRRAPIFILDEPHYHRARLGQRQRFRGVALAIEPPAIHAVVVRERGVIRAEAFVDGESADVASVTRASGLPDAERCRFALDLDVRGGTAYVFHGRCVDGTEVPLFVYDLTGAEDEADRQAACLRAVCEMPMPPADLLLVTQGGTDVESYRDSIVSAHLALRALLGRSGVDPDRVRRMLDIGCGTGRLLAGWRLDEMMSEGRDEPRTLVGVDIDAACIEWNRTHLPDVADWEVGSLGPPLTFADRTVEGATFDLIVLASVFTHLSLDRQRGWVRELARLVRPDGAVVITLHGEPYAAALLDPDRQRMLREAGHLELETDREGGHAYLAFHEERFAYDLFGDAFAQVDGYPRGVPSSGPPRLFPCAALQDVYILRAPRERGSGDER